MRHDILSVSELLKEMKETISQNERLQNVALIGEVSNFSAHRSGHFYFSLKDEASRISCVMFKTAARQLRFEPKAGDKVILVGQVGVFEASGSVQFYANKMILDGLGQLHQQFEKLKMDFQKQGYFDNSSKKPIPTYPKSIALITGQGSAAYADMHETIQNRWPLVKVHVLYSLVQGEQAKHQIVANLNQAQSLGVDTIILARGGGSIEDLWAFNEPEVVLAIAASQIPVVTGIGHESDTTLSDLVADLRAATPTAAVVATVPDGEEVRQRLRGLMNQYYVAVRRLLRKDQAALAHLQNQSVFKEPERLTDRKAQILDYQKQRLNQAFQRFGHVKQDLIQFELRAQQQMAQRLQKQDYILDAYQKESVQRVQQRLNLHANQVNQHHNRLTQSLHHTSFNLKETMKMTQANHHQLINLGLRQVQNKQNALRELAKLLDTLSPLAIMAKGYALTYHEGAIIKTYETVQVDDLITIRYQDGLVKATVTGKEPHNE